MFATVVSHGCVCAVSLSLCLCQCVCPLHRSLLCPRFQRRPSQTHTHAHARILFFFWRHGTHFSLYTCNRHHQGPSLSPIDALTEPFLRFPSRGGSVWNVLCASAPHSIVSHFVSLSHSHPIFVDLPILGFRHDLQLFPICCPPPLARRLRVRDFRSFFLHSLLPLSPHLSPMSLHLRTVDAPSRSPLTQGKANRKRNSDAVVL